MTKDELTKLNESKPSYRRWMITNAMTFRSDSKPRVSKGTSQKDRHKIESLQERKKADELDSMILEMEEQ